MQRGSGHTFVGRVYQFNKAVESPLLFVEGARGDPSVAQALLQWRGGAVQVSLARCGDLDRTVHHRHPRGILPTFAPSHCALGVPWIPLLHPRLPNAQLAKSARVSVHRFLGCAPASESGIGRGQTSLAPRKSPLASDRVKRARSRRSYCDYFKKAPLYRSPSPLGRPGRAQLTAGRHCPRIELSTIDIYEEYRGPLPFAMRGRVVPRPCKAVRSPGGLGRPEAGWIRFVFR